MDNHYHIIIETIEGNLSAGMRQLNGVYTQWHNRARARVGHVFQGRFKAIIVQRESYLLELVRYVVLNAVRAGICATPQDCCPKAHAHAAIAQFAIQTASIQTLSTASLTITHICTKMQICVPVLTFPILFFAA